MVFSRTASSKKLIKPSSGVAFFFALGRFFAKSFSRPNCHWRQQERPTRKENCCNPERSGAKGSHGGIFPFRLHQPPAHLDDQTSASIVGWRTPRNDQQQCRRRLSRWCRSAPIVRRSRRQSWWPGSPMAFDWNGRDCQPINWRMFFVCFPPCHVPTRFPAEGLPAPGSGGWPQEHQRTRPAG
jgi:hypothetical protein